MKKCDNFAISITLIYLRIGGRGSVLYLSAHFTFVIWNNLKNGIITLEAFEELEKKFQ